MRLLLVRHGESTYNAEGRVQGRTDAPLSERGNRQVKRLGERLRGYEIAACFSSDLQRAANTAKAAVSGRSGRDIVATPLLQEIGFGDWEGMHLPFIESSYPDEYLQWREGHLGFTPPGAETIEEQRERAGRIVAWLREHAPAEGNVLVVSHGGIMRAIMAELLDLGVEAQLRFHFDNTSLTVVEETPRGAVIRLCNDTSHLGAESPFP